MHTRSISRKVGFSRRRPHVPARAAYLHRDGQAHARGIGEPKIGDPIRQQAGLSQVCGHDIEKGSFTMKQMRVGDTASGVEVARTNEILSIDVTPCAFHPTIVTFAKPYQETRVRR